MSALTVSVRPQPLRYDIIVRAKEAVGQEGSEATTASFPIITNATQEVLKPGILCYSAENGGHLLTIAKSGVFGVFFRDALGVLDYDEDPVAGTIEVLKRLKQAQQALS